MKKDKVFLFIVVLLVIVIGVLVGKRYWKNDTPEERIIAKDNVAPIITLNEDVPQIIVKGTNFKTVATANDDVDGDITEKIEVENVDTSIMGEQEVLIKVSDKAGNTSEKKQKIIVREELTSGLPVLMYHFFYDDVKYFKQDNNWLKIEDFEKQLAYLSENNFYFPPWEEVEEYLDGKIKLPSKSVVLTCDDGDDSFFDLAVPVMEKYKVPVTSFVVTDWYGHRYNPDLKYVVWESHSANMHQSGGNGKGRMVNWNKAQIVEDLRKSSNVLGGATVFCYPFGHYNDTAIEALKEADYKLAFTVEGGRVKPSMNKFKLPRVRINGNTSISEFKKSVD